MNLTVNLTPDLLKDHPRIFERTVRESGSMNLRQLASDLFDQDIMENRNRRVEKYQSHAPVPAQQHISLSIDLSNLNRRSDYL